MAATKSIIQNAAANKALSSAPSANTAMAKQTTTTILNAILDGEGYRKRFDELLGKRAPQFISSIISLASNDAMMKKVVADAPNTIIASALKAATLDLPIEPALGLAYVVAFKNSAKDASGNWVSKNEAQLIIGYRGMIQLAMRTGVYRTINVTEIREGELVEYDRVRGYPKFNFIQDDAEREKAPIIGYCAYYELLNGAEKYVYWSKDKITAHEIRNRKGQSMSKGWRDDFDAMAKKTVIRELLSKWGIMSIDYHTASPEMAKAADAMKDVLQDENDFIDGEDMVDIDMSTGEILPTEGGEA